VLGVWDHLGDAVLGERALDQGDQLLGRQGVELDPAGPQEGDLLLGRAAFPEAIVADMLQGVLADRLILEPARRLAGQPAEADDLVEPQPDVDRLDAVLIAMAPSAGSQVLGDCEALAIEVG
jgi:hypothetical protein